MKTSLEWKLQLYLLLYFFLYLSNKRKKNPYPTFTMISHEADYDMVILIGGHSSIIFRFLRWEMSLCLEGKWIFTIVFNV